MTVRRKWLLSIGASLLGVMLLAASFCVGVWVGERGLTRDGLQSDRVVPGAPVPGQPNQAPPPGLPVEDDRVPVLRGVVRGVRQELITLETVEGLRLMQVSPETVVVVRGNGERSGSVEDLKAGVAVAVVGRMDPETRTLLAENVIVLRLTRRE